MMLINIERDLNPPFYFKVSGEENISAFSARKGNFLPCRLMVSDVNTSYELFECEKVKKFVSKIFNIPSAFKFTIIKNESEIGFGEPVLYDSLIVFNIKGDRYELRAHSNDRYSLTFNNVQIALFSKANWKKAYDILFNSTYENKLLLVLIAMYIDYYYYSDKTGSILVSKYEKNYVLNDEYEERANWIPED